MSRLEQIREMLESEPDDEFLNFSLAMELVKAERTDEALAAFEHVLEMNAKHSSAYFQKAKTLIATGRHAEARDVLAKGMAVAAEAGDTHTRDQMAGILQAIPPA